MHVVAGSRFFSIEPLILAGSSRNLAGMAAADLPEILCDAEAEYSRLGGWERVFPCPEEPTRCVCVRVGEEDIMQCNYYCGARTVLGYERAPRPSPLSCMQVPGPV